MEDGFKKSAPWITYFRKLEALFGKDPEIKIEYFDVPALLKMYVDNPTKAEAISQLLPDEVNFGGVTAEIRVVPSNKPLAKADLFAQAFTGNPAFSRMVDVGGVFTNPIHYCVFNKEVVQYWDDNLGDINGNESTLYQNIAEDVFEDTEGVMFCTEDKY